MKKSALIFSMAAAVLLLASCDLDCIRGNGRETTENRTLDEFSGIDVGGAYKLQLTCNEQQSLVIRAEENLLPLIKTEVRNGKLRSEERRVGKEGVSTGRSRGSPEH